MNNFRSLSPLDFEELVRDLLQAELGLRMESFGPGKDLGIDFRFATANGTAIVQAKHYLDSRPDALVRTAKKENSKVERLKPSRYIFATSASLTPLLKKKIREAVPSAPLVEEDIFGQSDLNNLLGKHQHIERKHFKLWLTSSVVLDRILHSGIYNRTSAEMDIIKDLVPKYVSNDSVPAAEEILKGHGILIISGEPGVGKTTLARILVWLHAEQGWEISVISDINEAFEIAGDGIKRLIFFDDFLGQIKLTNDLIRGTDHSLPLFLQKVQKNKNIRFILTTRDYILHQAQAQSSRLNSMDINQAQYVLNVGLYTRMTKAAILYNHIYFSDISADERHSILENDFFMKIIDHRNFSPRLIDLFLSGNYVSIAGKPIRETITTVLDNPQELWEKPYRSHISDEGRGLMMALFFNSNSVSITTLEMAFERMVRSMGLSIPISDIPVKFRAALKELEGSILEISNRLVSFSNPGVRDFLERAVSEDRFFIIAINAISEFQEVKQTWDLFWGRKPQPTLTEQEIIAWNQVAKKLLNDDNGSLLERFGLSIDMYDRLESTEAMELVVFAIEQLKEFGIEDFNSRECEDAIRSVEYTLLPSEILEDVRKSIHAIIGEKLIESGADINLEDISSVTNCLSEYGAEQEFVMEIGKSALTN